MCILNGIVYTDKATERIKDSHIDSPATPDKLQQLTAYLSRLGSVAVAFSGGVDSTFLLKVAHDVLGENAIAFTAASPTFPKRELTEAQTFCAQEGIRQIICYPDELTIPGFADNPPNRCYLCKRRLFETMQESAKQEGINYVLEGSNLDDLGDYRPGLVAIKELGVISPLRDCGLRKADIRELSKHLGLSTHQKPSFACLSSRFAYGETITKEKLSMVEEAEQFLLDLGFSQFRVRIHGMLARIEVLPQQLEALFLQRDKINERLSAIGFLYVTMDLSGYRMGSMNDLLGKDETGQDRR